VTAVLALDQGTTGSTAIVFDEAGAIRGSADREIRQSYPASGHVEHDPDEIFATTVAVGREALTRAGLAAADLAAIGITNQRETTVVWERATGRPIHPAVVWQSRASAAICERLRADGHEKLVRERTGLVIDAYFSGTKIRWILDQVPGAQKRAEAGELACGTIDTWLIWNLTGGRTHATDVSNASRTMVFNIHRGAWDDELLGVLDIPRSMMAAPVRSSGIVGEAGARHFGAPVSIAGIAGDQQAARVHVPVWRAESGERRNEVDVVVAGEAGRERLRFGGCPDDAETVAKPLHRCPGDEGASFERVADAGADVPGDRRQETAARRSGAVTGVHEKEAARPVGVLRLAECEAGLS
jgi:glycerol kinase